VKLITYQADLQDSTIWHNHKHSQYHQRAVYNKADEQLARCDSLLNVSHPMLEVLPLQINTCYIIVASKIIIFSKRIHSKWECSTSALHWEYAI